MKNLDQHHGSIDEYNEVHLNLLQRLVKGGKYISTVFKSQSLSKMVCPLYIKQMCIFNKEFMVLL